MGQHRYIREEDLPWNQAIDLENYVRRLLELGKRSQHLEFQHLFSAFGKVKITEIAKRILSESRIKNPR